jgi:hypothetical protein
VGDERRRGLSVSRMRIAAATICIVVIVSITSPSGRAQTGDVFSSGGGTGGNTTGRTGTQGIEGNPNCPPPIINGIKPKNWSCKTGTQAVPGLPPVGYGDEPSIVDAPTPSPSPSFSVTAILSSIKNCWMQTFLANGRRYMPPLSFPSSSYPLQRITTPRLKGSSTILRF